jgi:Cu+-exporting ATPase
MSPTSTGATTAGTAQVTTTAHGMDSALSATLIERALQPLPGVGAIRIAAGDVVIEYDPAQVTDDQVREALVGVGFDAGDAAHRSGDRQDDDDAKLVDEGRRLLVLIALSAVTVPLMLFELLAQTGPWVEWVLAGLAAASLVVSPELYLATVQTRLRGLLQNRPVVRASAFGGLAGGLIGLLFGLDDFPTGGFFAATVLVVTYHVFSMWLTLLVRTQSSQSVKKVLQLQPDTARLVRDRLEGDVPVKALAVGDVVRVRPGERVPIDGRVIGGQSAVDEALVTGESVPVKKREGDEVIGGAINGSGTLLVEVARIGQDTFLQQIVRNIEDARALKPGVVDLVGRVLKIYIPTVLVLAVVAGLFWVLVPALQDDGPDVNRALIATLGVLIMAYPCAVGMAAPLGLVRGAGDAAEQGIVLRTGEAFQTFGEVRTVVFDKTGTLTEGAFTVREVEAVGDADALLALAAAAEAPSEHPLAAAVVAAARERELGISTAEHFDAISGYGVRATVDGADVVVGRPSFVAEHTGGLGALAARAEELEDIGRTVVAVSQDGELQGLIALGDDIRLGAHDALDAMRREGLTPVMVTGDNRRAARRVADELGIETVRAEVLPQDKAEIVRELQREGRVAMIGDGVNDAPALAQADVGIAMGGGTDIAIESADVVIVGNRLDAVLAARDIGQRSYRRTKYNLILAFLFNGIGVPAAATGLVYPIWAMAVMFISVTAVFANSMRGKWLGMFATLRTLVVRQLRQRPATA